MDRTRRDYLLFGAIAGLVFILVVLLSDRAKSREDMSLSRALDTVNIGTTPNDGTGDPLRTAFLKVNKLITMADSLDLELLTNEEVQALKDVEDLADGLLFPAGDTTVTAEVGKIVFKSSDATWYGCVRATPTTRWEPFN